MFGLVVGSFTLGYKLQLSTAEIRAEQSDAKLAEFRGLQTKERFLVLYLRYLIAKNNSQTEPSEENERGVDEARDAFSSTFGSFLGAVGRPAMRSICGVP